MTGMELDGTEMASTSLSIVASDQVSEALSRIGRTEDIRFSPDQRRLVLAGYVKNVCLILDIVVDRSAARPVIRIHDHVEIRSKSLNLPHGLDFIGANRLVVANRRGHLSLFSLPDSWPENRILDLDPVREIHRANLPEKLKAPGSLCVLRADESEAEVLVCNNYGGWITRHILPLHPGFRLPQNSIFLRKGFDIPDGIAINPARSWIAISNHNTHSVLMFDLRVGLKPDTEAHGELSGAGYPHGLRFSPDGRRLYVADAGAPQVRVYQSETGDWNGGLGPHQTLTVLDDETFAKGHVNPQEGGPKGLDLSHEGDLMAITCDEQPLAFFHLPDLGVS